MKDQVLRVRRYRGAERTRTEVSWKGPARVTDGYKARDEIQVEAGESAEALLRALGYEVVDAIDRRVEYFTTADRAVVRLEWYPRMDVLVEVEGEPTAIEIAIRALGMDRGAFTADALPLFVARYQARTGREAAVSRAALGGDRPSWDDQ